MAVGIKDGEVVSEDMVCYDMPNFELLAGQLAQCDAVKKTMLECESLITGEGESAPSWYESPILWGIIGLSIGVTVTQL